MRIPSRRGVPVPAGLQQGRGKETAREVQERAGGEGTAPPVPKTTQQADTLSAPPAPQRLIGMLRLNSPGPPGSEQNHPLLEPNVSQV